MKKLIYIIIALPFLFSCSKKKGCNYSQALNYDNMVVIDDGSCTFSNLTFFADTTRFNGNKIMRIDITIENEVIGSFNGMHINGTGVCGGANTATYNKSDGIIPWASTIFLSIDTLNPIDSLYYHNRDSVLYRSGEVSTSPLLPCIPINALY